MKTINKLIIVCAALLVASVTTSTAQTLAYAGTLNGGTNTVSALTTNSYQNITINYSKWFSFQPEFAVFNGANTGASNVTFVVQNSVDSAVWNTVTNYVVAGNGTNIVGPVFAVDSGGTLYWRVQVQNTNTVPLTNVALPFGKRSGL